MKNIFSGILTFLAMISCLLPVFLFMVSCAGIFVSSFYLIILIVHLIWPHAKLSKFIDLIDPTPARTIKIKKWLYILLPVFWILMMSCSLLNSWYQNGTFWDMTSVAMLMQILIFETSIILTAKKWNTVKSSGLILIIVAAIFVYHSLFICWGETVKENWTIHQKIVNKRLLHDLPEFTKLVKQVESKDIGRWD